MRSASRFWHSVAAFEAAGLKLYNEAVLVTSAGSLPLRAGKPFEKSRKLGKSHQNVLVFVKGDPVAATAAVGPVEFGALDLGGGADDGEQPVTPVEKHGNIWLKRDDLFEIAGVRGGKVPPVGPWPRERAGWLPRARGHRRRSTSWPISRRILAFPAAATRLRASYRQR